MLKLQRSPVPQSFKDSDAINDAIEEVKDLFGELEEGSDPKGEAPKFPEGKEYWGSYKAHLAEAQHHRCGYCEMVITGLAHGDVEHYRPKGRISTLDLENQGRELDNVSNVKGRKFLKDKTCTNGYWWLAYDWDNYLFSCPVCNRTWKKDLFPVEDETNISKRPMPGIEKTEKALLLNPFEDDPPKHLRFNRDGTVEFLTPQGKATVETVGLSRTSLNTQRRQRLYGLFLNIKGLLEASQEEPPNATAIRISVENILYQGDEATGIFPGATRAYFERVTPYSWEDLKRMSGR